MLTTDKESYSNDWTERPVTSLPTCENRLSDQGDMAPHAHHKRLSVLSPVRQLDASSVRTGHDPLKTEFVNSILCIPPRSEHHCQILHCCIVPQEQVSRRQVAWHLPPKERIHPHHRTSHPGSITQMSSYKGRPKVASCSTPSTESRQHYVSWLGA